MTRYVQWTIKADQPEFIDIIIALLNDFPFTAYEELENNTITATISEPESELITETYLIEILAGFATIIHRELLSEENWNEIWESNFDPVEIENICRIAAPFHPEKAGFTYSIKISPKMAFGTGHHATTRMMVTLMNSVNFHNKQVFDFGTGTGVLAILAAKMGASHIIATDIEPWALDNSRENVELNNITSIIVNDQTPQQLLQSGKSFDIILANIQLDVLTQFGNFLHQLLKSDGSLLISGVLESNRPLLEEYYSKIGLYPVNTLVDEKWICQQYVKHLP